jgi:LuxR family maltose regulon positive regulatory protein
LQVEGFLSLALVLAARGRFDEAMATFEAIPLHRVSPWDVIQVEVTRVRVLLAQGQLAEAVRWVDACQHARSERQPGATPVLFGDMEDLALARVALAQGRAEQVIAPLEDLRGRAERGGRGRNVLEARILLARARWMLGQRAAALADLGTALELAAPEGFARLFLDEGDAVGDLLAEYAASRGPSREREHALKLLVALGRPASALAATGAPAVALSAREVEVLRLLAAGRSNEAIAEELVVALSTAKWHVAQIYRKLGVRGRMEAAARARELRLIA